MAEHFYTILTDIGKAKIANSQVLDTKVNMTAFAVGDGSGAYYNPVSTQTALKNEVWRGNISKVETDESNPNWIVIEAVIPTTDGGFMIREAAIFDAAGDMIAIGKHAETYKPVVSEGSAKDLFIRMILEVSNTASVTLKVDPAVVLATKQDVNAIAGAGRTIETVKGNADAIANLSQTVTENQASVNAQLAEKATDTTLGRVQVNGTTILADANGIIGVSADVAKFKKGSSTYTDTDTSQTFTDAFCTLNSLVTIVITSVTPPKGVWSVESANGSFTITSTVAESADISFDYFIQKAVG